MIGIHHILGLHHALGHAVTHIGKIGHLTHKTKVGKSHSTKGMRRKSAHRTVRIGRIARRLLK